MEGRQAEGFLLASPVEPLVEQLHTGEVVEPQFVVHGRSIVGVVPVELLGCHFPQHLESVPVATSLNPEFELQNGVAQLLGTRLGLEEFDPLLGFAPVEGEAQKVERIGSFLPELHNLGLVFIQFQMVFLEPRPEACQKGLRRLRVLETEHRIVRVPHHLLVVPLVSLFEPRVDDIVEIDVGQNRAHHRTLRRSDLVDL